MKIFSLYIFYIHKRMTDQKLPKSLKNNLYAINI